MCESSSCSMSSPTFCIDNLFYFSHSSKCVGVYHCSFYFHFTNDSWYWAYFCVLIWHLYIVFDEMSIKIILPIFKLGCFIFFLLDCTNSSYILDKRPFPGTFYCFIPLVRTFSTLLKRSSEIRHPYLVPDLRGKSFTTKMPFIRLRKFPYTYWIRLFFFLIGQNSLGTTGESSAVKFRHNSP